MKALEKEDVLKAINEVCDAWYMGPGRAISPQEKASNGTVRGLRIELLKKLGLDVEWPDGFGPKAEPYEHY